MRIRGSSAHFTACRAKCGYALNSAGTVRLDPVALLSRSKLAPRFRSVPRPAIPFSAAPPGPRTQRGAHNGDIPIAGGRSRGWGNFWIDCSLAAHNGGTPRGQRHTTAAHNGRHTTGTFLLLPVDQGVGALSGSTARWSPRDLRLESSPKRAAVDRVQDSLP
jgi:hypothetical protein